MEFKLEKFIGPNDEYLIIKNGEIIKHSNLIQGFEINESMNLKIIYDFDSDAEVNFRIATGIRVNITELFTTISGNIKINLNIQSDAYCDFVSIKKNSSSKNRVYTNIILEDRAYIKMNELAILSSAAELESSINLNKPEAHADIKTVTINVSSETQIFTFNVFHNAPATKSELNSFGIVNNESILNINTDGAIQKHAAKAEIRQKTKGLILGQKSQISATPILEINDYDVIASHGASIGAIDEEQLFYLMSRGISRDEAEKLVISGFINPFFTSISDEKLQVVLQDWVNFHF